MKSWAGAGLALGAAALFGFSAPLAKLLLGQGVAPVLLAGLLYITSGLGLSAAWILRKPLGLPEEASVKLKDAPLLALTVLAGGVAGPVLLMVGLAGTPAAPGALLLNVEGLATMAIAWLVFRESVDRRLLVGAAAILAGAGILAWQGQTAAVGLPALAIVGACLCWAIDNNLTRKLSGSDPVQLGAIKNVSAGAVTLAIAFGRGAVLPAPAVTLGGALVGVFGYGVSLVLFIQALRRLGTARTSAYFSVAPFLGAALALVLFKESASLQLVAAALLMSLGVYLHLSEQHAHEHAHEALEHEHRHRHDAHHQHAHGPDDPPGEPHVHGHRHTPLTHSHAHYPDLHHRHGHGHSH